MHSVFEPNVYTDEAAYSGIDDTEIKADNSRSVDPILQQITNEMRDRRLSGPKTANLTPTNKSLTFSMGSFEAMGVDYNQPRTTLPKSRSATNLTDYSENDRDSMVSETPSMAEHKIRQFAMSDEDRGSLDTSTTPAYNEDTLSPELIIGGFSDEEDKNPQTYLPTAIHGSAKVIKGMLKAQRQYNMITEGESKEFIYM